MVGPATSTDCRSSRGLLCNRLDCSRVASARNTTLPERMRSWIGSRSSSATGYHLIRPAEDGLYDATQPIYCEAVQIGTDPVACARAWFE